jgi:hypothetical protein
MHDRHGKPLAVGDKVVIEGTVTSCYDSTPDNEYCNVTITTDVPMAGNPYNVTLNAKQTTKVE